MQGHVLARTQTAFRARTFSTQAGGALPITDLALRAMLRNLRLLSGMRPGDRFSVLLVGYEVERASSALSTLEPHLDLHIVGAEGGLDAVSLERHVSKDRHAAILLQPYHILRDSRADLASVRRCLHDEDGALGMLWVRATPQPGWMDDFARGVGSQDLGAARGLAPGLQPGQTPMAWVDGLAAEAAGFRPFKHRKFVEKAEGTAKGLAQLLRETHDARFPATGPAPQLDPAVAAVQAGHPGALSLHLDLHGFHSQVVPQKPGKKKA